VKSIGDWAFSGCTGLIFVTIENGVISIGERAFSDCIRLMSLTIGNSIEFIGEYAFSGCIGLTSVSILNPVPPTINHETFLGLPASVILYVPEGSIDAYRAAEGWNNFNCVWDIMSASWRIQ
jgi:hypothetical protein